MRLGLQQIKDFSKKIELPGRSKFRTFDSLFGAIENYLYSQKPTYTRRDLQQYSAESIRTISKYLDIEGWTKDRRKATLIDKILAKNSNSNEILKQKFQWEELKVDLRKIQQPQQKQKPRKPRKPRKPIKPRKQRYERKPYSFVFQSEIQNKKFGSSDQTFTLKINRKKIDLNPLEVFQDLATRIIKKKKLKNGDIIRIFVNHPKLDNPISTPQIKIQDGKISLFELERYFRALEYKEIPLNEIEIVIQTIIIPKGKGRLNATKNNLARKTSVITIKNSDSICAARAIVTAI